MSKSKDPNCILLQTRAEDKYASLKWDEMNRFYQHQLLSIPGAVPNILEKSRKPDLIVLEYLLNVMNRDKKT